MNSRLSLSDKAALRAAAEKVHEGDSDYKRAVNIDFAVSLIMVVLFALFIRSFIGEPVRVDGYSMFSTLNHNERLIIEKLSYSVGSPKHGDIIVCYYPGYKESCIKRVIATGGDTIRIDDGKVYVNDNLLDEPYINEAQYGSMGERTVEQGHVFVMGDNRNHSTDSRSGAVGEIPHSEIVGRAIVVVWPFNKIRGIS